MRLLAPALVVLVLAGCGDAGPTAEEQVRTTVGDFGNATAAKDYHRLCEDILAPQLVDKVTEVGLPCETALREGLGKVRDPHLTIGRVQVNGDSASAEIRTSASGEQPSKDTLKLVKVNGNWRIASLGGS